MSSAADLFQVSEPSVESLEKYQNCTVEEYLRLQCEAQVEKLLAHAREKIEEFRKEAAAVRKNMEGT